MDIKNLIAKSINYNDIDFSGMVSENLDKSMGDYSIACFSLAKILRKSPVQIANEIKDNISLGSLISKVEVVNGYINFFLNKNYFAREILKEIDNNQLFEKDENLKSKTICLDYSSVNLAKYMHIGHLSTTIIGESLARIFEEKGYNVVRINYIGDFGTPFGKMVYAHLTWGSEKELEERGVDYLQDLYVEFCKRATDEPELEEYAREYFKKICDKDTVAYPIYLKFIDISKIEAKRILDELNVHFDSWKGESAYSDELNNIVSQLNQKGLLKTSQGAQVVDLEPYDLGTCLIQKSDGTSLYTSRDIAAAIDRYNQYHFDQMIYVTAVQQKLHFEQFFKVLELMGYDFASKLSHVYYGMFSLPTGKIASRKGKQAVLVDLMEYSKNKVNQIIAERNYSEDKKSEIAKKIAYSALKFTPIKNERIKDTVFDVENAFSFDGDTSAYMQYTYARICSILKKANIQTSFEDVDFDKINSDCVSNLIIALNNYSNIISRAVEQKEPSIISKYTMDMCKLFSKFYTTEKVMTDDVTSTKSKLFLLVCIKKILEKLFHLICIDVVDEM